MQAHGEILVQSLLDRDPRAVWERIASYEGINDELWPWLRMTAPRQVRQAGLSGVAIGERLCRSWVLLFGLLPIDYDDITLVRLDAGRGFVERSPMLSQRLWEHERTLEARDGRCLLSDRVRFEPRLRAARPVAGRVLEAIFQHRHRRLRRRFGGCDIGGVGFDSQQ